MHCELQVLSRDKRVIYEVNFVYALYCHIYLPLLTAHIILSAHFFSRITEIVIFGCRSYELFIKTDRPVLACQLPGMLIYLDLTEAEYLENIPLLLKFVDKQKIRSVSLPVIGKMFTSNSKKTVEAAHQLGIKSLPIIRFEFPLKWPFHDTRKGAHLGTCLLTLEILFDTTFFS